MIKKLLILVLFIGIPIMIYAMTVDNKIYYVALGDSLAAGHNPYGKIAYGYTDYVASDLKSGNNLEFFTKKFASTGSRTTDLINDINDNIEIDVEGEKITIKHALTKADVVTLSTGLSDLCYKMGINNFDSAYYSDNDLKKYVDEVIVDIEHVIILMQKYCKEDIILVGFYNPLWHMKKSYAKELDPIFVYANEKMKKLSKDYNLYYVDIHSIFEKNIDYLPNPLNIHPSDKGYSIISNKIMKIINTNILK